MPLIFALAGVYLPPTHWAYEALSSLASRGLIKDTPAWLFRDSRFLSLPSTHFRRDPASGYRTWNHASRLIDRRFLTRAQAAKLIEEALEEFRERKFGLREAGLLQALCEEFERELEEQGIGRSWWECVLGEPKKGEGLGVQVTLGREAVSPGRDILDLTGRLLYVRVKRASGKRFLGAARGDFGVGKGREGDFRGWAIAWWEVPWRKQKFSIGVDTRPWWGPGKRGSMLLGGFFPPSRPFLSLSYGFRLLGREVNLKGVASRLEGGRYFVARRLEWSPTSNLRAGFSEAFVKEGAPRALMWAATCTPFPLTAAYELGREEGNALVSLDVAFDEGKGLGAWGELFVDDFIWRKGEVGENEFGALLGLKFYDRRKPLRNFLLFEYARTDRLTYREAQPKEEPRIGQEWLGHWLGPDAQNFYAQFSYELAPRLALSLAIEYTDYEISLSRPEQIRRREQVRTLEAVYTLRSDLALRLTYQDLSRYGAATPSESERRLTLAVEGYF